MTDMNQSSVSDFTGRDVVDPNGDKVGTVTDVYLDNDTDQPEWLAVSTGMFGSKVSFVPLSGASFVGDELQIDWTKDVVKDAPNAEADGELSPDEESALYAHYGRGTTTTTTGRSTSDTSTVSDRGGKTKRGSDDAMTRSEEEIDVNKSTRETGTARLRKWVETENVQMTVPIKREKARLVVEPATDADRTAGDLTSDEQVVTLSEEVVDVDKRVVAKEKVRLETDVETDEVVVDESVRKERIEMDNEKDGVIDDDVDRRKR